MVLQKQHDKIARWGTDGWIIETRARYRWTDIKNRPITDWFCTFEDALSYLITTV
jgi:hypothetical protein